MAKVRQNFYKSIPELPKAMQTKRGVRSGSASPS